MTDDIRIFDASKVRTLTELMDVNERLVKENNRLREKINILEKERADENKVILFKERKPK